MIRVAIIDDHPVLRAGLETILRGEPGFTCVGTAGSSDELWPLLRRARPAVLVLDARLGDEDGVELCRRLREEPGAPAVVMYTASTDPALRRAALAAGAGALVEKSADLNELFDEIRLAARTLRAVV